LEGRLEVNNEFKNEKRESEGGWQLWKLGDFGKERGSGREFPESASRKGL